LNKHATRTRNRSSNSWSFFHSQAAVRSSRRKRSQYVAGLKDQVERLRGRRRECQEENGLLTQLHTLWSRLVAEVEEEIQVK